MSKIIDRYNKHFLRNDFIVCAMAGAIIISLSELYLGHVFITSALDKNHAAAYTCVASVTGSLLGFAMTAVSLIVAFLPMPQLSLLRDAGHSRSILDVYFQAILWLGLTTVLAFVGLIADTDARPVAFITHMMIPVLLITAARVCRSIQILKRLTDVVAKNSVAG